MELILCALCALSVCGVVVIAVLALRQLEKQRTDGAAERKQLLDRIQATNFNEYKAQERADKPKAEQKKGNPLDKEQWR